ncbi:VHL domain containing protein [Asbolus verrucosus]|uniref:VHL domain containing protein n=1 Tax=Asbolus verrucosus TaxID=1661398 RepID=A0A482VJL9_ASBVE|nr:VHL domain containing protein [Asbolus verrucosus]
MEVVRSQNSNQRAFIRFLNLTERTVEVVWVNFTGAYVCYQLLEKGNFIDINTYKTHPWIAVDHGTKDRLHIDKEFVYYPKTAKEFFQNHCPNRELPSQFEARIRAVITIPLYSLRYTTLLSMRNFLRVPDDVDMLELPKELINDLKKVITQRNNQIVHTFIRIG